MEFTPTSDLTIRLGTATTSIALFVDRGMLPGAHVVLHTALTNFGGQMLDVHIFQAGLSRADTSALERTLLKTGRCFQLAVHAFDPTPRFGHLKALQGNHMTYGRLLLPELLPHHPRVLYLDCDLLVQTDLQPVFETNLNAHALAAVTSSTFVETLDAPLGEAMGIPGTTLHFNAGVLLFDLDRWRDLRLAEHTLEFAAKHALAMQSHDQTALNFVFKNRVQRLSLELNICVPPWARYPESQVGILHFIGSPKPFEPGARWFHACREDFERILTQTGSGKPLPSLQRLRASLSRVWRARYSIARCLFKRVTGFAPSPAFFPAEELVKSK